MWSSVPEACGVLFTSEAAHETRQRFLLRLEEEGFRYEDRWTSGEIQYAAGSSTLAEFLKRGFALIVEKRRLGGDWFTIAILSPTHITKHWECHFYVNGDFRVSTAGSPSVALFNAVDDVGHSIRRVWPEWSHHVMKKPFYLEVRTPRELGSAFHDECVKEWNDVANESVERYRRNMS